VSDAPSDPRARLREATARLEDLAAALAAGGGDPSDMVRLAEEAMTVSEQITRLIPASLDEDAGRG
jgi:hypothetical protein